MLREALWRLLEMNEVSMAHIQVTEETYRSGLTSARQPGYLEGLQELPIDIGLVAPRRGSRLFLL